MLARRPRKTAQVPPKKEHPACVEARPSQKPPPPVRARPRPPSLAFAMRLSGLQKEVLTLYRQCLRESRKKPKVCTPARAPATVPPPADPSCAASTELAASLRALCQVRPSPPAPARELAETDAGNAAEANSPRACPLTDATLPPSSSSSARGAGSSTSTPPPASRMSGEPRTGSSCRLARRRRPSPWPSISVGPSSGVCAAPSCICPPPPPLPPPPCASPWRRQRHLTRYPALRRRAA